MQPPSVDRSLGRSVAQRAEQLAHRWPVRHSIIVACWHMLATGEVYRDNGGDYSTRLDADRQTRRLVAQLERLGHVVTLQEAAA